ncbi:MAG TPA: hypothetical protein VHX49_08520 [Candidatus Acidoferrales bacterium]|jgi:hypothetical protein|nr:hypothetical protein [Candidatus Acidoferrales bacterium]
MRARSRSTSYKKVKRRAAKHENGRTASFVRGIPIAVASMLLLALAAPVAHAQSLNWEGQTGALVTPFAYTSASPANGIGLPAVSFHYLDAGDVLGGFYEISGTVGFLNRFEAGYSRALSSAGTTPGLSPLFAGGFNIFHGKANLLRENAWKQNYLPAISVGFVARTQVRRVGGVVNGEDTSNGDFYAVATKTITQIKALPIVASLGFKVTNAAILGLAGNAPDWQGCVFGALGFVLPGPAKSKLVVGSEALQEPHHIQGLLTPVAATLPTTLTYFVRVLPPGKIPLNVDFGVAQIANRILPGVALDARSQFAFGISYKF